MSARPTPMPICPACMASLPHRHRARYCGPACREQARTERLAHRRHPCHREGCEVLTFGIWCSQQCRRASGIYNGGVPVCPTCSGKKPVTRAYCSPMCRTEGERRARVARYEADMASVYERLVSQSDRLAAAIAAADRIDAKRDRHRAAEAARRKPRPGVVRSDAYLCNGCIHVQACPGSDRGVQCVAGLYVRCARTGSTPYKVVAL